MIRTVTVYNFKPTLHVSSIAAWELIKTNLLETDEPLDANMYWVVVKNNTDGVMNKS